MYEPEEFLETLDNMIALSVSMLQSDNLDDEEIREEILLDLARLRDLHHRIRLQFGLSETTWH